MGAKIIYLQRVTYYHGANCGFKFEAGLKPMCTFVKYYMKKQ